MNANRSPLGLCNPAPTGSVLVAFERAAVVFILVLCRGGSDGGGGGGGTANVGASKSSPWSA